MTTIRETADTNIHKHNNNLQPPLKRPRTTINNNTTTTTNNTKTSSSSNNCRKLITLNNIQFSYDVNDKNDSTTFNPKQCFQLFNKYQLVHFSNVPNQENISSSNDNKFFSWKDIGETFQKLNSKDQDSWCIETQQQQQQQRQKKSSNQNDASSTTTSSTRTSSSFCSPKEFLQPNLIIETTSNNNINHGYDTTTSTINPSQAPLPPAYCSFVIQQDTTTLSNVWNQVPVKDISIYFSSSSSSSSSNDIANDTSTPDSTNDITTASTTTTCNKNADNKNSNNSDDMTNFDDTTMTLEKIDKAESDNDDEEEPERQNKNDDNDNTHNNIDTSSTNNKKDMNEMNWKYEPCIWIFFGRNHPYQQKQQPNTSSYNNLQGRPEHTDSVSHDGTWHYQLSGTKVWYLRPTTKLIEHIQSVIKEQQNKNEIENDESILQQFINWYREDEDENQNEEYKEQALTDNNSNNNDSITQQAQQQKRYLEIECNQGDVIVINTRLWKHQTIIPCQTNPSVSYARDFYLNNKSTSKNCMTNVDGLYASEDIDENTILFRETDMPDCELHRTKNLETANCHVVELDDGTSAVISSRTITAGEFFCLPESSSEEDNGDDEEAMEEEIEEEEWEDE